jgi:two-component system, NarL family, sensor histidine kinase NreB
LSLETREALETREGLEGTILCADDTEAQRYAVARVLRRAGYRVLEASTGKEALEMTASGPDLVVLDVNLPDISGIEVCRQIKSCESTARVPVLQVSATFVSTEARVAGLEGGADAYLVQPIAPDELTATVRALLRVRRTDELLWKSQLQYRAFFEANPLPCWVFDTSTLAILTVNAAAVQYYGYSKEEFTTLTLRDLFSPEEQASLPAFLSGASSQQSLRTWKHRTRIGKSADVEMSWAPLELNGRAVRLVIVQDITERLELQAAEKKEEIRQLLMERILHVQEDERRRIARELHDEAGQLMTSLLVGLRSLTDARRLADAKKQAKRLREIASGAIDELGRLSRGLHSSVLDNLGLQAAVGRYADDFSQTHSIRVNLEFGDAEFSEFSRDEQSHLFRIVQEAFTNIARHSQAKSAWVKFDRTISELHLTIRDDGQGFATPSGKENLSRHLGIEGMRQRAAILGGTLEIASLPAGGVGIQLRIPRKKHAQART